MSIFYNCFFLAKTIAFFTYYMYNYFKTFIEMRYIMSKHIDLLQGNIAKTISKLALPLMGMSLLQMAYNLTDIFWIGKMGPLAVAAVGTGGQLIWLSTGIHTLAQLGGQVYVAQNLGAKDYDSAGKFAHASITLSLIITITLGVLFAFFNKPIISIFNLSDSWVVTNAQNYISITGGFIVFLLLSKLLTALITTTGNSKTPFIATSIGLVFNIIFDPILIYGFGIIPGFGVVGAAIATVLAQIIVFSILFVYVLKDKVLFSYINFKTFPDFSFITKILKLGFPVTLQASLFPLISIYISRLVAGFSDSAVAVQRVGSQIESISWMTTDGFGIAVNSFIAQNYGAGNISRTRDGYFKSFKILTIYGIFATFLLIFAAKPIFGVFLSDADVLSMGVDYLIILGVSQLFMCWEILSNGSLNALGKTILPATISIFFTAIRIPLAHYLIQTPLGLNGIWWSITTSTILKGIFALISIIILLKSIEQSSHR